MSNLVLQQTHLNSVKEKEYIVDIAADDGIKFSKFTSCIGVVSLKDEKLSGTHLMIAWGVGDEFDRFEEADAGKVESAVPAGEKALIFGMTDFWEEEILNSISDKYNQVEVKCFDDGAYWVKHIEGKWVLYRLIENDNELKEGKKIITVGEETWQEHEEKKGR